MPNWEPPDWNALNWVDPKTENSPALAITTMVAAFSVAMMFHSRGSAQGARNALAVALAWLDRYHELGGKERDGLRERLERIRALPDDQWQAEMQEPGFRRFLAKVIGDEPLAT